MAEDQQKQKIYLRQEAVDLEEKLIEFRRHIHQNPELCYKETETASYIVKKLQQHTKNLKIIQNVGVTGVVALLEGKVKGQGSEKCILIRGDMDALPLTEKSGDSFASKIPGKHHACGHDGHVSMLLGAAIIADKWVDKIKGTIKFCFQPAEEGGAGAKAMIEDKQYPVLENPSVDKCYGIHLNNNAYFPKVDCFVGPTTANSDRIIINITGKGGHAMSPDQTTDALLIGCNLVQSLYSISSRNLDPTHSYTVSFGKIQSGTAPNIIASECFIEGTARTLYESDRQIVIKRLKEIIKGFEISYECKIELEYRSSYNSTINDEKVCEDVKQSVNKIVNITGASFGMAGEDFSFFAAQRPSSLFTVGSAPEGTILENGKKVLCPHHSPLFRIDESSLVMGTSIWAQLIEDQMVVVKK